MGVFEGLSFGSLIIL